MASYDEADVEGMTVFFLLSLSEVGEGLGVVV